MRKTTNIAMLVFIGIVAFTISLYFDSGINLLFKSLGLHAFDFILIIVTNFAFVSLVILLIPSIIFHKELKKLRLFWIAFTSSVILSFIIKIIVSRQRPAEMLSYPFIGGLSYSFPSMHAMVVFSALPLLAYFLPKQKNLWILFAFLVAFTRIYFGFHFLSDVVFGAFAGYLIGLSILELHYSGKL